MKKIFVLFVILSAVFACSKQENEKRGNTDILGQWKLIRSVCIDDGENMGVIPHWGYIFFNDSLCDIKRGFYSIDERQRKVFKQNISKYKINDNLIHINNNELGESKQIIESISADSLILVHERECQRYSMGEIPSKSSVSSHSLIGIDTVYVDTIRVRQTYIKLKKVDKPFVFDNILIIAKPNDIPCITSQIYIRENGDVLYEKLGNDVIKGISEKEQVVMKTNLNKGKIDSIDFVKLKQAFDYVDFDNLENEYGFDKWMDRYGQTIHVHFLKDKKIIKSVSDYGCASPSEFAWAVLPIWYVYQDIKLESIEDKIISYRLYDFIP